MLSYFIVILLVLALECFVWESNSFFLFVFQKLAVADLMFVLRLVLVFDFNSLIVSCFYLFYPVFV